MPTRATAGASPSLEVHLGNGGPDGSGLARDREQPGRREAALGPGSAASRPGLHGDGATLYLAVAPGGSKSWIRRVTVDGRRRHIGLGGYPAVSLAKARQRAMANRVAIAYGIDPLAEKRRANTPTFRAATLATFEANRPRWRSARTARAWMQSLEGHVFPAIGALRVHTIAQDDVLRILKPLWSTRPQLARKLRQHIRAT